MKALAAVLVMILASCAPSHFVHVPDETVLAIPSLRIPLEIHGGQSFVQGRIAGEGPFLFLVDTGSGATILSKRMADKFHFPSKAGTVRMQGGAGVAGFYTSGFVEVSSISLGEAEFRNFDALIMDFTPHNELGVPVDGILGFRLFGKVLLTIDGPAKEMRIERGELVAADEQEILNYDLADGTPRIVVKLGGLKIPVLIDSGGDVGLMIPEFLSSRVSFLSGRVRGVPLSATGGTALVSAGRVKEPLRFGLQEIPEPLVLFSQGLGVLGAHVLKHYAVTFDQRSTRVRIRRPQGDGVRLPSLRGVGLFFDDQGRVAYLMPQPRVEGIRLGDRVEAVNGRPIRELGFQGWNELIEQENSLSITFSRNNQHFKRDVPVVVLVP